MDISIVIVNFNMIHFLEPLLSSIKENVKQVTYEVIVVDNNSNDGSRHLVKEKFTHVTLIEMDSNSGFSIANNYGARTAKGKYLLILNPDTIVSVNALESMFNFLEQETSAGVVGCKLLNPDGSFQRSCGRFPKLSTEIGSRTFLNRFFPHSRLAGSNFDATWDYSTTAEVDWVTGACLMIRKELYDTLGGFDESMYMYYEDVDLCFRAKKLGWRCYYVPRAHIYHYVGGAWKRNRAIPIFNGCRSSLVFFSKHYKTWQSIVLRFLITFEIMLFYTIFLPYLAFKGEEGVDIKSRINGYNACLKLLFSGRSFNPK